MATLQIDGCDFYYEVHGNGYPLVLAHGVGGNHASWFNQVPVFAKSYKVVLFDHRGFGNSRDRADGPGRARFVPDLLALFDHLGLKQAALVAQSMGGGTCSHFTWKYPQRVKALVLADTLVGLKLPGPIQDRMRVVNRAVDNLSQFERVLGESFRKREPAGISLYAAIASFNLVNRNTLTGTLGEGPSPEQLGATGVPILFLVGQEDILFPPAIVSDVHALVKGSQYVEVPGAGHSAYFEAPHPFNEAVLKFLADAGV